MPQVSLYIPCYNAAPFIERCLDCIFQQTYPIEQIYAIDDGSTDNTFNLLQKYSKVTILRHEKNKGLAAARNTALNAISTPFIANIDADCLAEKNWLEKLMNNMTEENIAGVGGQLIETNQSDIADYWRVIHMKQHWGDQPLKNPDWLFGHSAVFRKSALVSIGGYHEKYRTNYEDLDLSRRLLQKGYTLYYTPDAIVRHLRKDTFSSILNTRWRWTALGVHGPVTGMEVVKNLGRNYGRSFKYMAQDLSHGRFSLLGLDFALGFYSSYADLRSLFWHP